MSILRIVSARNIFLVPGKPWVLILIEGGKLSSSLELWNLKYW